MQAEAYTRELISLDITWQLLSSGGSPYVSVASAGHISSANLDVKHFLTYFNKNNSNNHNNAQVVLVHTMETSRERRRRALLILNHGSTYRCLVNFTLRPLCHWR